MIDTSGVADAVRNLSQSVVRLLDTAADCGRAGAQQVVAAIQEERRHRIKVAAAAAAVVLSLLLAGLFAGIAVLAAFWGSHPVLAAALIGTSFLLLAAAATWILMNALRRPLTPADWVAQIMSLVGEYRASRR
jgi:hypothetical protein